MSDITIHEDWMRLAIDLAAKNQKHPFAALIVDDANQQRIGSGVNNSGSHPLLHGEIVALQSCTKELLKTASPKTLYSTAEPCPMCMGAIIWAGIETVCFGTSIQKLTELGWTQIDINAKQIVQQSPRKVEINGLVLEAECNSLFEAATKKR